MEWKEKGFILLQITILTVIAPILIFLILKSFKVINTVMASEINERKLPLVLQSFLLILLVKNNITIERYFELHFFFLAALISTIIVLLLLFVKIKASIHMLAMSSLTVFVIGLHLRYPEHYFGLMIGLVLLNGVIASSRLVMKAHTYTELAIGTIAGVIPQVLLMVIWA